MDAPEPDAGAAPEIGAAPETGPVRAARARHLRRWLAWLIPTLLLLTVFASLPAPAGIWARLWLTFVEFLWVAFVVELLAGLLLLTSWITLRRGEDTSPDPRTP